MYTKFPQSFSGAYRTPSRSRTPLKHCVSGFLYRNPHAPGNCAATDDRRTVPSSSDGISMGSSFSSSATRMYKYGMALGDWTLVQAESAARAQVTSKHVNDEREFVAKFTSVSKVTQLKCKDTQTQTTKFYKRQKSHRHWLAKCLIFAAMQTHKFFKIRQW